MHPQYTSSVCARFWPKVDRRDPNGCWVWTAKSQYRSGSLRYGMFWNGLRYLGAHVASWEIHYGPVPDGACVLHNCPGGDNPLCVNPTHLWLGSHADNARDRSLKGRSSHLTGRRRLTAEIVREIRTAVDSGETQRVVGSRFGVSQTTVWEIWSRRTWAHVA